MNVVSFELYVWGIRTANDSHTWKTRKNPNSIELSSTISN